MMCKKDRVGNSLAYVILTAVLITMILPFYWMVATSLKTENNVLKFPPDFFPWPITLKNYQAIFNYGNVWLAFFNSSKISVLVTCGTLFTSSLAAFSFAKLNFSGKKKIYGVFLATIMIPGQLTLVPLYLIFSTIGWTDSILPLVVPGVLLNAYGMFMIRSFMETLPNSYVESAYIDGANPFKTYLSIILPMCKPILVTLGLFTFNGAWNDFMGALIYLDSESKFTITLLLSTFRSQYNINWANIMAASTVAILPILLLYIFSQRFFVEGIVATGLKG